MLARRRTPRLSQARRPQTRFSHRAAVGSHLDLAVEPEPRHRIEIDSRRAFHDHVPAPIDLDQIVEGGLIVARIEPPPTTAATRRVGHHHRVAGNRMQGVGTAQVGGITQIVSRHRQPHRVDVTADEPGRRAAQRGQLGSDRAGHIVNHFAAQPLRPMQRDRCGAGLLQRFVGEQPVAGTGQPGKLCVRTATQQYRLHQHRRPVAELLS